MITNCAPQVAAKPDGPEYRRMEVAFYTGFGLSIGLYQSIVDTCVTEEEALEIFKARDKELREFTEAHVLAALEQHNGGGR